MEIVIGLITIFSIAFIYNLITNHVYLKWFKEDIIQLLLGIGIIVCAWGVGKLIIGLFNHLK